MLLIYRQPEKKFRLDGGKSLMKQPALITAAKKANDRMVQTVRSTSLRIDAEKKAEEARQRRSDARNPHLAILAMTYDMTGNLPASIRLADNIEHSYGKTRKAITDGNSGNKYNTTPLNLALKMHDLYELGGRPAVTNDAGFINLIRGEANLEDKRANYMPLTNHINGTTTPYEAMDELAHAIQFKNKDINNSGLYLKFLAGLAAPDSNADFSDEDYTSRYHIPGTVEYEAHHVIEPHMYDYLSGKIDKSQMIENIRNATKEHNDNTSFWGTVLEGLKQRWREAQARIRKGAPNFHPELYPARLKKGGTIHIKEKNKGKFTKSAKAAGESVQEHARKVLASPNATQLQKKRALFAINAKKWHK